MKKLLLSIIIAIFASAGVNKVTTISQKVTKDALIFVYDVPDKNFEDLKSKPEFYKKLLTKILCKNQNAKLLVDTLNIVYNYKKHSNNQDKIVITIKKGACSSNQ